MFNNVPGRTLERIMVVAILAFVTRNIQCSWSDWFRIANMFDDWVQTGTCDTRKVTDSDG